MAVNVDITQVIPGDETLLVRGTVDGRGYSIQVPVKALEGVTGKNAKQRVIAKFLKDHDEMLNPPMLDLAGTVVL